MICEETVKQISDLSKFFLDNSSRLLNAPYHGNLNLIEILFRASLESQKNVDHADEICFTKLIELLNICSGGAFEIGRAFRSNTKLRTNEIQIFEDTKLLSVSLIKLEILVQRINSKRDKEKRDQDVKISKDEIFPRILNAIQETFYGNTEGARTSIFDILEKMLTYGVVQEMLQRQTAAISISREKIKMKFPLKPYFDICDDSNHINILSKACFSRNENDGINTSDSTIARNLRTKGAIPEAVFKCYKTHIHFLPIVNRSTDLSLGDCSYLDTCHKMRTCRYLHYYTLKPPNEETEIKSAADIPAAKNVQASLYTIDECFTENCRNILPAQWINCDVRLVPFEVLGKFSVIISDPAWDIHMSLPYGTCKDLELLSLPMHVLQDEGLLLLWVTGRSIEIGRQALMKWGYRISDELIWVKLNQLKRTIVTGRTGHWLNHSKEHLLVGIKGKPKWMNRLIDTDVIVSGTRETSRKPDEVYDIVERITGKYSRKLEIFGRDNNIRPGWLSMFKFIKSNIY